MSWKEYSSFSSSNVRSIRYENELQILEVTFHNGGIYQYYDIPMQVSQNFEQAPSKGKFLAAYIKGHYRYGKI